MAFKIYDPYKRRSAKHPFVKANIRKRTNRNLSDSLNIVVSIEILKQIGVEDDFLISFYVDDQNPKLWKITKAEGLKNKNFNTINKEAARLIVSWNKFSPSTKEQKLRGVHYEIINNELYIDFSKDSNV